jgi:glycosyltransferase involved in cell wall biosynthesis
MKFSVLIAAYRAGPFLPAALASVAGQSHSDWELVVVEDGSRDGTEAIVRAFADVHAARSVRYENLGENRGVAAARNRLLALAEGEAVAFLDADDLWQPGHLADLATALFTGAALAFSGIELWNGDQHTSLGPYLPPVNYLQQPRAALFQHSFIQTSSCVALPRATIARIGWIDERMRIGEDRDYWFRAVAGGARLACTGRITCRYTKHAGSSMTQPLRVAADTVTFYRKHLGTSDLPSALRLACLAHALVTHGRLLRASDPLAARALFREAVHLQPWRIDRWPWLLTTLFSRAGAAPAPAASP